MYGVLNVDKIKNLLHSFVVLGETNILSLISQSLDNFYQIKTKVATVWCDLHYFKLGHPTWELNTGHVCINIYEALFHIMYQTSFQW
jgi:hypothetical protein